jgi:hypothetical protein
MLKILQLLLNRIWLHFHPTPEERVRREELARDMQEY